MKLFLSFLFLFFCVSCNKDSGEMDTDTPDEIKKEYKLVWQDEFEGLDLDTTKWNYEVNGDGGGNNELQYYTKLKENCFIDDSCLVIQALKKDYLNKKYTSARINSTGKGDWKYGRFEVKAKLPYGQGLWPAIWMLPTEWVYGGWPLSGEIDIMEELGQNNKKIYGTIHFGDPHQSSGGEYTLPNADFSNDYHVFAIEWLPSQINWYVDSTLFFSTKIGKPFDQKFHFVLNVAVGGNWPGSPDATTHFPQQMKIDYVRVYQLK